MKILRIFSFISVFVIMDCCKFNAQVRSETDRDVWAQFTWFNKTDSEIFKFSKYGETKNFTITGTICNLSPTILKVSLMPASVYGVGGNCRIIKKKLSNPQKLSKKNSILLYENFRGLENYISLRQKHLLHILPFTFNFRHFFFCILQIFLFSYYTTAVVVS